MTFWSERSNIIEPKRKYRFTVEIAAFQGQQATSVIWFAKSVTIPSYTVTSVTHKFLDNQYHFPGHIEWNEVSLKMVDPVDPDAVFITHDIILNSGYAVPSTPGGTYSTISKGKAVNSAGLTGVIITQLNAEGNPLDKWTLNNPFVTGVEFGEMVYEGDDLREIDMKFKYDWATCERDGLTPFDPVRGPGFAPPGIQV